MAQATQIQSDAELELNSCATQSVEDTEIPIIENVCPAGASQVATSTSTVNSVAQSKTTCVTFSDKVDIAQAAEWDRRIEHIWNRYNLCYRRSELKDMELNDYKQSEMNVHTASCDHTRFHKRTTPKSTYIDHYPCPCSTCNNYNGKEPNHYRK